MRIKCPACGNPFLVTKEGQEVVVWCAYGKCPSLIANNGKKALVPWSEANERTLALQLALEVQQEQRGEGDYE